MELQALKREQPQLFEKAPDRRLLHKGGALSKPIKQQSSRTKETQVATFKVEQPIHFLEKPRQIEVELDYERRQCETKAAPAASAAHAFVAAFEY